MVVENLPEHSLHAVMNASLSNDAQSPRADVEAEEESKPEEKAEEAAVPLGMTRVSLSDDYESWSGNAKAEDGGQSEDGAKAQPEGQVRSRSGREADLPRAPGADIGFGRD